MAVDTQQQTIFSVKMACPHIFAGRSRVYRGSVAGRSRVYRNITAGLPQVSRRSETNIDEKTNVPKSIDTFAAQVIHRAQQSADGCLFF